MLKLNVGFNRKIGEANYGSRGAAVALELELESGLVDQPAKLKDRIRQLFTMAKAAVDEELAGQVTASANGQHNGHAAQANGHGHDNGRRRDATRKATASQARALNAIADRQGVNLADLLRQRFGVDQAGDLSITEASALIDQLKAQANGNETRGRR